MISSPALPLEVCSNGVIFTSGFLHARERKWVKISISRQSFPFPCYRSPWSIPPDIALFPGMHLTSNFYHRH